MSIKACCLMSRVEAVTSRPQITAPARQAQVFMPGVWKTANTAAITPTTCTLGNTLVLVSME